MANHSGAHAIVEMESPLLELILEVDIPSARAKQVSDARHGEIVRRHEADGSALDQVANHSFSPEAPVPGVGSVEQLIEQEKQWQRAPG